MTMLRIGKPSARRWLNHLLELQRQGEALLKGQELLMSNECSWQAPVWRCLDKIAGRDAFQSASQVDREEVGPIDLLAFAPARSDEEMDRIVRRRIHRRLITLASVIEKVEALIEPVPPQRR